MSEKKLNISDKEKSALRSAAAIAFSGSAEWDAFWKEYAEAAAESENNEKEIVEPRNHNRNTV
jgi:hypothetical protein